MPPKGSTAAVAKKHPRDARSASAAANVVEPSPAPNAADADEDEERRARAKEKAQQQAEAERIAAAAKRRFEEQVRGLVSVLSDAEARLVFGPNAGGMTAQTNLSRMTGHQALAPVRFLTPFETAVVCALDRVEEIGADRAQRATDAAKLSAELRRAHQDEAQAQRELRAAQDAHVTKLARQTAKGVFRRWQRVGNVVTAQMRTACEVYKVRSAKGKQDEMLRDTEELTRRLVHSVVEQARRRRALQDDHQRVPGAAQKHTRSGASVATQPQQGDDSRAPAAPAAGAPSDTDAEAIELDILAGGNDSAAFEGQLRLLNTLDGARPLRDYQRSALRWMINLYNHNLNGILADEMGLGKTVQTIALLAYFAEYKQDWGPHVVVVPTTVVLNWEMEFRRWLPGFKCISYIGTAKERKQLRQGWTREGAFNVVITSYGVICRDRAVFRRRPWGFLILDEAHTIKNWASQKWQALFDFQAEYRLLLTGTPLQNSVMELWSLFHFLLPSVSAFESNDRFREWFSDPLNDMVAGSAAVNEDLVKRLHALFRPFLLRRLKKDVEVQLPGKTERVVLCPLSRRQRGMYSGYLALSQTRAMLARGGFTGAMGALLALRKVCDHPELFAERPTVSPLLLAGDFELRFRAPRRILILGQPERKRAPALDTMRFVHDCGGCALHQLVPDSATVAAFALSQCEHITLSFGDASFDYFSFAEAVALLGAALAGDIGEINADVEAEGAAMPAAGANNEFFGGSKSAFWQDVADVYRRDAEERRRRRLARVRDHLTWLHLRMSLMLQLFVVVGRARRDVWPRLAANRLALMHPHLAPPLPQRLAAMDALIRKFVVVVPKAAACNGPSILCFRPVAHFRPFRRPTRTDLFNLVAVARPVAHGHRGCRDELYTAAHFCAEGWAIHNRGCFNFPDKTLIIHDAGKLQVLAPLLKKLLQDGHRALIFTQFTAMLGVLEKFLALLGVKYLRLDGATKPEVRQQLVERFNYDERVGVMILSTRSGGIGINLTGADTVIFYDSDWSPAMDLQAQDRVHRIGQTKPVTIYRLVSENTVEERILQKARERKKLNNVVIRGGAFNKGVTGLVDTVARAAEEEGGNAAEGAEDIEGGATAAFLFSSATNIRAFFHDFDEDYEPDHEEGGSGGEERDVAAAMAQVEDADDVVAQRAVEGELQAQRDEDALVNEDNGATETGLAASSVGAAAAAAASSAETVEGRVIKKRRNELAARQCANAVERAMLRAFPQFHKKDMRKRYARLKDEFAALEDHPTFELCVAE